MLEKCQPLTIGWLTEEQSATNQYQQQFQRDVNDLAFVVNFTNEMESLTPSDQKEKNSQIAEWAESGFSVLATGNIRYNVSPTIYGNGD